MTVTIENTYTGNGTKTDYQFNFPYLDEPDIKASLDGVVTTNFRLLNATTVQFVNNTTANTPTAPGNGVAIRIYRETAYENPKATFYPGAAIRAGDLNDNTLQNLYVNQESNDKVADAWLKGDPTIISTESWYTTDDTKIASTKAIENRINSQIDTALTGDVVAGSSITIADNTPSAGKITISVNAATTSASGSMSAADKSKLDGIESNATADQTNAEIRTAVEAATDSNVFTDADHTKLNGIETGATADQSNAEIRAAVEAASDSNVFTDADHTKLNGIETNATADQTAAEIKTAYESNAQTNPLTDAEKAVIDGVTANTSELNKLDGVTATTAQLNIVSGKTFRASGDGNLTTTSDTEIPSSKVIAAHVASAVTNVGGFVTIANEISFPTTANQPANGVIVSISDAAGTVINGSGVSTTGRTTDGTPATVTINNFPSSLHSETLASGVALLVTSTGSSNTYNYHKILAAETDVKSLSDDINDFNARYRVASSAPGSNNDDGDLWFDTSANKMKVYNATGSSWDDVASVGQFFINTISSSSGTGGGSATFNGSAYRFTLSNPATGGAQQLLVSVNGVLQKPNTGTSQPSEGFAIDGNDIIFSAAPASGSDYFIVTQGSSVSIGTPSANSVNSSHIIDGSIVNADVSNSADIAGSKVADDSIPESKLDVHNAPATGKYLKYTSNGMEWSDSASEGTDVKSTGESGGTKFLREDGDGTSSWQTVPPDSSKANLSGAAFTGNITFPNDVEAVWGGSSELQIGHDGTTNKSVIQTTTADPLLVKCAGDLNFVYSSGLSEATGGSWDPGGAWSFSHGSSTKLTTTATGINVTGAITVNGTALSAAPEITGTASTALSIEQACIVHSDGTIKGVTGQNELTGTAVQFNDDSGSKYILPLRIVYNPDKNNNVILYVKADNGSASNPSLHCRSITVSGTSITLGTERDVNTDNNSGNANCIGDDIQNINADFCYDTHNDRFLLAYRNVSNGRLHTAVGYTNSAGDDFTFGNGGQMGGSEASSVGNVRVIYNPDYQGALVTYKGSGNYIYRAQGKYDNDNNDWDWDVYPTETKNESSDIINTAYDTNVDRYLICYRDNQGSAAGRMKSIRGSDAGDVTSEYSFASGDTIGNIPVFVPSVNKFVVVYARSGDSWQIHARVVALQGSAGNPTAEGTEADIAPNNSGASVTGISAVLDESTNKVVVSWHQTNNVQKRYIAVGTIDGSNTTWTTEFETITGNAYSFLGWNSNVDKAVLAVTDTESSTDHGDVAVYQQGSTNLTSEGFIGYSKAAYSSGATATVKVTGNTATKSGMTPGLKHYVQNDGGVSTTPVGGLSVEAGIALTSTKLLIKG